MKKRENIFAIQRRKILAVLRELHESGDLRLELGDMAAAEVKKVHTHPFFELFFFRTGRVLVQMPGRLHYNITPEERRKLLVTIWIRRDQVDWVIAPYGFLSHIDKPLPMPLEGLLPVLQALPELLKVETVPIRHDLARVIIGILIDLFESSRIPAYEKTSICEKALQVININYNDPSLSVRNLAAACGYSPQSLNTVFRRKLGCSIRRYIIRTRLRIAAYELVHSSDPDISTIAHGCGFNDRAYFSNSFRKMYGISPRAYCGAVRSGAVPPPPLPDAAV